MSGVEASREGRAIWAPTRAEASGVVGVGWVKLLPGEPGYAMWDRYLKDVERRAARRAERRGRDVEA